MTPQYKLKQPFIYDCYEGEYPVAVENPCYRAIFKASGKFKDGIIRTDKRVLEYVSRAKNAGRKFGLYHFLAPHDIQRQFDTFMGVVAKTGMGHMPLTIDVEIKPLDYGSSTFEWGYQIKTFIDMLKREMGYKPIIYTSLYFWTFVSFSGWYPQDEAFLWVAQYPQVSYVDSFSKPYPLPKGWYNDSWAMCQYAEDGRTQGYFINDLNIISDWFKEYLDSIWIDDFQNPTNKFPFSIEIGSKKYKENQ